MAIKPFYSLILCLILSSFVRAGQPAPPKDVDGWSKAKWGMTEQEILSAFAPDVKKRPQAVKYEDQYFDLVLGNFKMGHLDFTVRFLMDEKSNKLTGVSLKSDDPELSSDLFLAIEKDLIQKYGPPAQRPKGNKLLTEWKFPSCTIVMIYGDSPLASRFMYINYRRTAAIAAGKP